MIVPMSRILLATNVLWSPALRDTLLRAAELRLFQPLWSDDILAELIRTILAKRSEVRPESITRTVERMRKAFPAAMIADYAALLPGLTNHPGDRHVLAAAIHGKAERIATWNRRHFLPTAERDHGIAVLTPDRLLSELWEDNAAAMRQLLIKQGADLYPPHSLAAILRSLERSGTKRFAQLVGDSAE